MNRNLFLAGIMVFVIVLGFIGCSQGDAQGDNTDPVESLLEQAKLGWENVEIDTQYVVEIPDSLKPAMAKWITETVAAASYHMAGGDYEDPEDVIEQAEKTAQKLFSRGVRQTGLSYKWKENQYFSFIAYKDLSITHRKIFALLESRR